MSIIYKYIEDFILRCASNFRVKLAEISWSLGYNELCFSTAGKFAKNPIAFYSKDEAKVVSSLMKSKSTPRSMRGGNFEISCTAAQKKSYQKWSRDCGFSTLSAFVNAAISAFINIDVSAIDIMRAQIKEEYNAKLYCVNTLSQIGNNLNQMSRNVNIAHFNGEAANWVEIHEELIKIYMLVHLLLAEIRKSEEGGSDA